MWLWYSIHVYSCLLYYTRHTAGLADPHPPYLENDFGDHTFFPDNVNQRSDIENAIVVCVDTVKEQNIQMF